jgi:hypothetical protein
MREVYRDRKIAVMTRVVQPASPGDIAVVRALFEEYARAVDVPTPGASCHELRL